MYQAVKISPDNVLHVNLFCKNGIPSSYYMLHFKHMNLQRDFLQQVL